METELDGIRLAVATADKCDRLIDPALVLGMNAVLPPTERFEEGLGDAAENRRPAVDAGDHVGCKVPVPDCVACCPDQHGKLRLPLRQALASLLQQRSGLLHGWCSRGGQLGVVDLLTQADYGLSCAGEELAIASSCRRTTQRQRSNGHRR